MKPPPEERAPGLRATDAKPIVDLACTHEHWHVLSKRVGCIHPDHGPYPFPEADHHSEARLVDGVPTRFLPG